MFAKLAEVTGKFVGAVVAGIVTPVLVNIVVAQIKEARVTPTAEPVSAVVRMEATPAPTATLLAPTAVWPAPTEVRAATPVHESRKFVWRPADDRRPPQ